ncbi:MAG: hypothetical protein ACK4Q5_00275 [Saprospiraceae bacterium]
MKQTLMLSMFLLLMSCKKEEMYWAIGNNWKGTQQFGKCTATLNGQVWEASAFALVHDDSTFYLSIGTYYIVDSLPTEDLPFLNVPFKLSKSSVYPNGTNGNNKSTVIGGYYLRYDDLVNARYRVDTTETNFIRVEEIDKTGGLMRGSFEVVYKRDDKSNPNWPPYARFEDGKFEVKI